VCRDGDHEPIRLLGGQCVKQGFENVIEVSLVEA